MAERPIKQFYEIEKRVEQVARTISSDYKAHTKPPIMVCLLNGGASFFNDLTRNMKINVELDYMRIKTYNGNEDAGEPTTLLVPQIDLKDRDVIIVDDMSDTGVTMSEALVTVTEKQPASVKTALFLTRKNPAFTPDYVCFNNMNKTGWFYGYGMDDEGLKRNYTNLYIKNEIVEEGDKEIVEEKVEVKE